MSDEHSKRSDDVADSDAILPIQDLTEKVDAAAPDAVRGGDGGGNVSAAETAASNIMQTQRDTVKNTISNLR